MLDVSFEFVGGILFVRLEGVINEKNVSSVNSSLTDIIVKGGIKYLVFNISNAIIEERVSLFDRCNILIKNNKGKMFLCGIKNKLDSVISCDQKCEMITNELTALKRIKVC